MERTTIRVLYVDDDPDDHVLVADMLAAGRFHRYEVSAVTTCEDGLRAIRQGGWDACLVDHLLGASTGLDLIRQALAEGCRVPLILLTGEGADDVDLAALHAGAADYLEKGAIDTAVLERSIRYSVERARMAARILEMERSGGGGGNPSR